MIKRICKYIELIWFDERLTIRGIREAIEETGRPIPLRGGVKLIVHVVGW